LAVWNEGQRQGAGDAMGEAIDTQAELHPMDLMDQEGGQGGLWLPRPAMGG